MITFNPLKRRNIIPSAIAVKTFLSSGSIVTQENGLFSTFVALALIYFVLTIIANLIAELFFNGNGNEKETQPDVIENNN